MADPIIERLFELCKRPLGSYPSPANLLDTWIIVNLKIEKNPKQELLDEREDLELRLRQMLRGVRTAAKLFQLVGKLTEFHREMWKMEDQIRDLTLPITTRQHIALEADMLNDERARLKMEINEVFGYRPGSEAKIRPS